MKSLMFVVPALVGGAIGIALAASHERLSVVTVTALVVMAVAVVAAPYILRELVHTGSGGTTAMPPFARVRDELVARSFRGPSLVHTRDLLALASNAYDLHFRLRPMLIGVVGDLLALRARIDFDDRPDLAHEHIGPALWEVVRPDRPVPEGRFGDPGLNPAQIDRLITDLEALTA